jgi:hypothetical protein
VRVTAVSTPCTRCDTVQKLWIGLFLVLAAAFYGLKPYLNSSVAPAQADIAPRTDCLWPDSSRACGLRFWSGSSPAAADVAAPSAANREKRLPQRTGRQWYEADVNYRCGRRDADRLVYSSTDCLWPDSSRACGLRFWSGSSPAAADVAAPSAPPYGRNGRAASGMKRTSTIAADAATPTGWSTLPTGWCRSPPMALPGSTSHRLPLAGFQPRLRASLLVR